MMELRNVDVERGGNRVLQGFDIKVAPGEIVALVGPNGAGKSTALGVLAGDIRPSRGAVTLNGHDVATLRMTEQATLRAVMRQSIDIPFAFTVTEIVEMGLLMRSGDRGAGDIIERAIARCGLRDLADRPITQLSGGERQRVSLARALVQIESSPAYGDPRFLLLDEPTASLDLTHQAAILHTVRELAAEGIGVLAVLHDLNLAVVMADRIAVLSRGIKVADGPPGEVVTAERVSSVYDTRIDIVETNGRRLVAIGT
ncbi:MAG: heme ABC transporter ATP-binding protein [Alphaproteobacteria bacterium]|nr:heme ABC transporter ATP-binding protein [Alphaproteobacteria bacterium]